jgi:hypothetical protein
MVQKFYKGMVLKWVYCDVCDQKKLNKESDDER